MAIGSLKNFGHLASALRLHYLDTFDMSTIFQSAAEEMAKRALAVEWVAGSPHPRLLYHLSYSYYASRLRYMSLV
jgi:hypothetical protein